MSQSLKEMMKEFEEDLNCVDITSIQPFGINMVDNPPHYNQGGIETIDYMKAYSTPEEFRGHCRLTAIKYLSRLNEKDNPLENAKKARWYLNKLIDELASLKD